MLGNDRSFSLQAVERLLDGSMPGVPRLGFSFIDVRDVAALEVGGDDASEAAGQRLIAAGPFLWLSEVAAILRERLGSDASKVPTRKVPSILVRAMALFDPDVRSVVGDLGKQDDVLARERRTACRLAPAAGRGLDRGLRAQPAR